MISRSEVHIPVGTSHLQGLLSIPQAARGLVIFAHGSGSSRFSTRNQEVARRLNDFAIATLLFDLLSSDEGTVDERDGRYRFNVALLSHRLVLATRWAQRYPTSQHLPLAYFGASTGAAAAIIAATEMPESITAVVSRGGRVDLAGHSALTELDAPLLMIVGGADIEVLALNRSAALQLRVEHEVEVIEGAGHLFEEIEALERVADLAAAWFLRHFALVKNSKQEMRG